jgi:hypothetical protein
MPSRLLDTDGKPREPVFWLLLWAVISVQLLALYAVCSSQVREAQDRRAQQVLKVRTEGCTTPVTPSLAQACATAASDRTIQASLGR